MIKKLFSFFLAAVLFLAVMLAVNTARKSSQQVAVEPAPKLAFDESSAVERLAGAVRIRTISDQNNAQANAAEFLRMHRHLEINFPRLHAALKRETISDFTLLFTWPGTDTNAKPLLLMAHMDVVPVDTATEKLWAQPAFSGAKQDGFVWGRGAWDNKSNLMSQFEAIELLLQAGFKPKQTIYLLLGADEEVNGSRGAGGAAALFKQRGMRFDYVLDEGLVVTEGIIPGIAVPAALVGVVQKGYMTAELAVRFAKGGHSSLPPRESVIGVLAEGIAKIENAPFKAEIGGVPEQMFERLAPEMGFPNRLLMSNLWLFGPMVRAKLMQSDAMRAQLHTTTAPTIFKAGIKDNILPAEAEARINFRIIPGDTSDTVVESLRTKVNDTRIEIKKPAFVFEPTRVSSTSAPGYVAIEKTVRQVFAGAVVAPGLFTARADAGYFDALADNVYLFSPVRVGAADTARFHGVDERISFSNYAEMIRFYHQLLINAAG